MDRTDEKNISAKQLEKSTNSWV